MMNVLAVCHTVVIETRKGKDYYNASSPDELALVNCAKYYGWDFKGRDENNHVDIRVAGKKEAYELLNVMEFTSGRKRMTVIVKDKSGKLLVMCKGADSIILERLADSESNKEIVEVTNRYLEGYAKDGLRTLLLGQKEITQEQYNEFVAKYKEASSSMTDRDDKIEEVCSEMERGFELIGSTAIDDKLQDDVDGTIKFMREAGIRVWVLTGDKIETAINIGFSCKLLTNEMSQYLIDG
jgi:magnesium-transporting ATPase (P-type)